MKNNSAGKGSWPPRNVGPKFKENYDQINWSKDKNWNRCMFCGKFINIDDFNNGKATRTCVSVDTEYSTEEYETYHNKCMRN